MFLKGKLRKYIILRRQLSLCFTAGSITIIHRMTLRCFTKRSVSLNPVPPIKVIILSLDLIIFFRLKKPGYILLIIILLLQSGGVLLFFQVQQCIVQYEMSEKLINGKACFEKVTLTISEYKKFRIHSNEIVFDGKMYDVKTASVKNNTVELLVINDNEEEFILKKIKYAIKNSGLPDGKLPIQLIKLISLFYLSPFTEHAFLSLALVVTVFYSLNSDILIGDSDIPYPPPRLS
jgi:hypothetical protein